MESPLIRKVLPEVLEAPVLQEERQNRALKILQQVLQEEQVVQALLGEPHCSP